MSCDGPGYRNPKEATEGPKEKILFVSCIDPTGKEDYVATIDVDPESSTYSTVIGRLKIPKGKDGMHDELHHFGWNACSSCFGDSCVKRDKLIFPCLNSDRIIILHVADDYKLSIHKTIEAKELHEHGVSCPHTIHCLPSGEVMISTMGDGPEGNSKGSFILLDANDDFKIKGTWSSDVAEFGYDFWYQPKFDVMVSSEWGAPKCFKSGFWTEHLLDGFYGHSIHFWDWKNRKLINTEDLGLDGLLPLELRFMHDPEKCHGFVGCAVSSSIFHFYREDGVFKAEKVISIPPKNVENWRLGLDCMASIITDILISMDDKFLYVSNWVHGDIRQYDITDPFNPELTGQVFLGGSVSKEEEVIVTYDSELLEQPDHLYVKDTKILGGPQMLQLSLDGKRLYVTNSLFSTWDMQFYPDLHKKGSCMIQYDVDVRSGGLSLNEDFLINFGAEPDGPVLAHEMRYPGGDCTSDIFVSVPEETDKET